MYVKATEINGQCIPGNLHLGLDERSRERSLRAGSYLHLTFAAAMCHKLLAVGGFLRYRILVFLVESKDSSRGFGEDDDQASG